MKIELPTFVILPLKKKEDRKYQLNLNVYRNTHYQTLNKAKKIFHEMIKPQLQGLEPFEGKVRTHYLITAQNNRSFDISNVLSVVEKFFCDALVHEGILKDDSFKYLVKSEYEFGGVTGERKVFATVQPLGSQRLNDIFELNFHLNQVQLKIGELNNDIDDYESLIILEEALSRLWALKSLKDESWGKAIMYMQDVLGASKDNLQRALPFLEATLERLRNESVDEVLLKRIRNDALSLCKPWDASSF